jgi:hypothetical protein
MFDKATFVQVPLTLTGERSAPVAVDASNLEAYRRERARSGGWARKPLATTYRCGSAAAGRSTPAHPLAGHGSRPARRRPLAGGETACAAHPSTVPR